jgi:hypothetical protein
MASVMRMGSSEYADWRAARVPVLRAAQQASGVVYRASAPVPKAQEQGAPPPPNFVAVILSRVRGSKVYGVRRRAR